MATSCGIIVKHPVTGVYQGIYVHHDGYPDGVGKTLTENYTDQSKIDDLIQLGDLSVLGEEIGEKHDLNWRRGRSIDNYRNDPRDKMCEAYGRDRGELGTKHSSHDTLESGKECYEDMDYIYSFENGEWVEL